MWTNGLFKFSSSFALDHAYERMRKRSYKVKSSYMYLIDIYTTRKELFSNKRIYNLSLKKHIKRTKRMHLWHQKEDKPSERSQALQKDELSRRLCPEGWPTESWFTWSTSPSKLLLHKSWIVPKSQIWHDKIQKKHWQLWKVGERQWLVFSFGDVSLAEKESNLLLSPVLDQWIKKALGSRSEVSMARFWSLYKPWRRWRRS